MDHALAPEPDPLTRLRAAAAAVSDLDVPGTGDQAERAADRTEPTDRGNPGDGPGIDAAAHADRYEELHDALVAVLADVDRG